MTTTDPRPANTDATPTGRSPAGPGSLSGHCARYAHSLAAAEGQDSPQANEQSSPIAPAPAGTIDTLGGQRMSEAHSAVAAEGTSSPQATIGSAPKDQLPAGTITAPLATGIPTPNRLAPEGRKTSHGHGALDTQSTSAVADDIPGGQASSDVQSGPAAGEQLPPAQASAFAASNGQPPGLAEHLLGFAADEVDDFEKVRISAENRLRALTRTGEDKDGRDDRGFGLMPPGICEPGDKDELGKLLRETRRLLKERRSQPANWDPYVWKLSVLVVHTQDIEKEAISHLEWWMKRHFLGPWVQSITGLGLKQAGRLIAATGNPASRSHVSHLLSYCGHGDPERKPFKGMTQADAFRLGKPEAKKRVRVIAMQVTKYTGEPDKNGSPTPLSPYREVYDKARAEYEDRVHDRECRNRSRINPNGCGTKDHPEWGDPGSPWRDGHIHQAALRKVGKQLLKDMWREARRIHAEQAGDLS